MDDNQSILGLVEALKHREISAVQLVQDCFEGIEQLDEKLHCFHETYPQRALQAAESIDGALEAGDEPGPLAGVPIALKDNIVTSFGHTTCSSRILEDFNSPYTSTAAQRLIDAGAIVIGKTNCDEFAMGSSTEHCAFGEVCNPWDLTRVPGGSSGGSAAAVAARLCPGALGSDTGGSIRQPASLCGVVGVKPSYGRVSRFGLVAFGSSLDQIGPLARCVKDAAWLLRIIAGPDRRDSTCSDLAIPDYLNGIDQPPENLRIGVPKQYLSDKNEPAVNEAVYSAIELYRDLGAEIVDIDLPLTEYGVATYYVIAPAEASSNLARYDGIRYGRRAPLEPGEDLFDLYAKSRAEGFGPEVKRRIMLGTYVLSAGYYDAYYKRALQVRRLIKQEFDAAFEKCHALLGPTSPAPAFEIGAKADPLSMYLCDVYTANTNIAGICGISIPAGFAEVDGKHLPIGLQIQCKAFDEATMFRIARMFEASTDYHTKRPPGIGDAVMRGV
ncbi:MAG: Asp-tRNA(Asn)/Glu-tRNA(Gln) amidotransferase subunit GatA [Planctomycetota bacterium]|nr:Asp-tRNA(Asn)/Glu-tRNA(Gln) amidotransferase subunit GatA [Planctomycetota bacterium]